MSTIFLARDSLENRYLANCLYREGLLDGIIVETGAKAKRRKLKRYLNSGVGLPWSCLDLLVLLIYSWVYSQPTKDFVLELGDGEWPMHPIARVDDVNDSDCIDSLRRENVDHLLVCGTALLRSEILAIPKGISLNLHGGIVPNYRNVHSDFWSYKNKDFDHLGASMLVLDKGVDSGPVAAHVVIDKDSYSSLSEVKVQLLKSSVEMAIETLQSLKRGRIVSHPQDESQKGFYSTPRALDIIKLIFES